LKEKTYKKETVAKLPEGALRGCTGCPCNNGPVLDTTDRFGMPKRIPSVKVKCGLLNDRVVSTFNGKDHEECDRRDHIMKKKMKGKPTPQEIAEFKAKAKQKKKVKKKSKEVAPA
jgi:hypothetical protein